MTHSHPNSHVLYWAAATVLCFVSAMAAAAPAAIAPGMSAAQSQPSARAPVASAVPAGVARQAPITALAMPSDMASRVAACTACHTGGGASAAQGTYYPRIAGKPEGYLYNQLLNFRDGRRNYPLMSHLLENLSDNYLGLIARYFAGVDASYPAPMTATLPAATLERGRRLVKEGDASRGLPACVQCHGAAMTGVRPAVPGLLGLPRDYLNAQLGGWKTGQRRAQSPDCMAQVAIRMDAGDIEAVVGWLASQPVIASGKPSDAMPAAWSMPCGGIQQ